MFSGKNYMHNTKLRRTPLPRTVPAVVKQLDVFDDNISDYRG